MALSDHEPREQRHTQSHPTGWEPSVEWSGRGGHIATGPLNHEPDDAIWETLIKDWGLDPKTTRIVPGSVQVRGWDANIGNGEVRRMFYYRASIEPTIRAEDHADIDALCSLVEKRKPKQQTAELTDRAMLVILSDWQLGKGEGGGSPATTERILRSVDRMVARVKELRKNNKAPESIYLIGLGDIVEQCDGHYDMQAFTVDLDRREQMRLARRLLLAFVEAAISLDLPVVLGAVPGNHGENRKNGKAFTTWTDNDDLAVFEQVSEILNANRDRYGSVAVPAGAIAEDLTMTLNIAGIPVGFAHGHQMRSGGPEKWWAGQALGRQEVADAELLITGHFHHLKISESTGRTWMQAPAMDGGSHWWSAQTGQSSPPGTLTLLVGRMTGPRGWSDLALI